MKKVLLVIGVLVIVIAAGVYFYLSSNGAFIKITVTEKEMGPFYFVYTTHKGDYSKVGPVMTNVFNKLARECNVMGEKGMGIYYNDPKTTKTADLKSEIGCLLYKADEAKADMIMKKMKMRIMYPKMYYLAEFPMKNQASFMLGVVKAYPVLAEYMKAKGYKPTPSLEIYEKDKIIYAFEIKK
jgi:hypothetical protein